MNKIATDAFSRRRMALAAAAILALPITIHAEQPDAMQLLKVADQARGGGLPGLVWEVHARNSGSGAEGQADQRLLVKAADVSSVAEVLDPPNSRGAKILQVDRNMWLTKPGLKKPVAISPRQRLTGQAAIGDIAATNYAKDYNATYLREEAVAGEPCHVLELKSANRQSTYDRVTYWISARRGLAVQAEFLSLSGKKLKSAQFEYGNTVPIGGRNIAFLSRMSIADALTDAGTVLNYSRVKAQPVASSEFDVGNLQ